jgi:alpha-mannosidase
MHDEATTHYIDMIDQTTIGHQFILQEFGEAANPRVGWQIDPFGHSSTHASLLTAELGLDATFFTKYDYQDHTIRRNTKELELIWRPSPALGAGAQVWTGTFPNLGDYGPPPGLCFDYFCQSDSDDPVQADAELEDYNLDRKVAAFISYAREQAGVTKGDPATMNLMWYLGSAGGGHTCTHIQPDTATIKHHTIRSIPCTSPHH